MSNKNELTAKELLNGTGPMVLTDGKRGKKKKSEFLDNGFTPLQEAFCRLVAQQPEDLINAKMLTKIYTSLPGITTKQPDAAAMTLYKYPRIQEHIATYRAILKTDRIELLLRREKLSKNIMERFENDPDIKPKVADMLQMQRDLEAAYGLTKNENNNELTILLKNDRVNEALSIIDVTPKEK